MIKFWDQNFSLSTQNYLPPFSLSATLSFQPCHRSQGKFVIFYYLTHILCLTGIMIWTRKHSCSPWFIYWEVTGFLGLECTFQGVLQYTPSWFLLVKENKLPKNHLYGQDVSHGSKKMFTLSIRYHSMVRKVMVKNIILWWVVHNLLRPPVYGELQGGLTHLTLTTPVMDFLYTSFTNFWHAMAQFISKIFRHVKNFSV